MKKYRIEWYTLENGIMRLWSMYTRGLTAKETRQAFLDTYPKIADNNHINPRPLKVKAVPLKDYYELSLDCYGQPDGTIRTISLSKDEYQALKGTGHYIFDSYIAAAYRAGA